MKLRIISILILISFLLSSCIKSFDYKASYEAGSYDLVIEHANEELSQKLNQDAIYYQFMSHFKLGYIDDSLPSARLYVACYNSVQDQRLRDALRILLFYSNDAEKCFAGHIMKKYYTLSEAEMNAYFTALMRSEDYQEADIIYAESKVALSNKARCMMLINGKASSELIVSELRDLDEANDEDFDSILTQAINVLNERGEGSMLLNLAIKHYNSSNDALALAIGDIYFYENDYSLARSYWSNAYKSYPEEVKLRLTYL